MKFRTMVLVIGLVSVFVLGSCQSATLPEASVPAAADSDVGTAPDPALVNQERGLARGIDNVNRLSLGTYRLEDGANAVTVEQAASLLPLWTLIQSGELKSAAETDAVIKQIEATMTVAQIAEIDMLGLTFEDVQDWMAEQGIAQPALGRGDGSVTGPMGNMNEEDRAKMREQFQGMQDLSPEERATAMAEQDFERPEGRRSGMGGNRGGFSGGGLGGNVMLTPLIELLTERASE